MSAPLLMTAAAATILLIDMMRVLSERLPPPAKKALNIAEFLTSWFGTSLFKASETQVYWDPDANGRTTVIAHQHRDAPAVARRSQRDEQGGEDMVTVFDEGFRPGATGPLSVLIVGGRATGTAALVHLAMCVPTGSTITVVDPADTSYPAVFDDPDPLLLSNTSAGLNSLFPELPGDFVDFARCAPGDVVPRSVVGQYCAERARTAVVRAALRGVTVRRIAACCRSVTVMPGGRYEACLSNGYRMYVTDVVIAVGVGSVRQPRGLTGIPPFPSARLRQRARSTALVVGQGQSAIDAALVLCAAGSHVVMASRTGSFPAVRTRTLPYPVRIGHTDLPVDLRSLVNEDCLAKGFPPLDRQFSHVTDPIPRLREEIELAATDVCPWQDSIVGVLDLLTARELSATKDKEFAWRYITSIILPNAQLLLSLLDAGQIVVEDLGAVDPAKFDLVVTATGFAPPPLHHTGCELFFRDPPARGARPLDQLDPHLRVVLTPERGPERIWAIGPASWPRSSFANFLRTAVSQARRTTQQITAQTSYCPTSRFQ